MIELKRFALLTAVFLLPVGSALGQPVGDALQGSIIAVETCGECHAIVPQQAESPNPAAPPFVELANLPEMTPLAMNVLLHTPHLTMPLFVLEEDEIEDITAYIMAMRSP